MDFFHILIERKNKQIKIYIMSNPICPECLESVDQEELDMFGGMCEECSDSFAEGEE